MKILRCAQDDSVDIRIGIILKGAALRLHDRSARGWGSLGSCPKRVVFRHGYRLHSALPSLSTRSEEGYLQRCGKVQFNFTASQSEIGVIWQKLTEVWNESSKSFHTSC